MKGRKSKKYVDFHNVCATIITEVKRKKPQPTTARL